MGPEREGGENATGRGKYDDGSGLAGRWDSWSETRSRSAVTEGWSGRPGGAAARGGGGDGGAWPRGEVPSSGESTSGRPSELRGEAEGCCWCRLPSEASGGVLMLVAGREGRREGDEGVAAGAGEDDTREGRGSSRHRSSRQLAANTDDELEEGRHLSDGRPLLLSSWSSLAQAAERRELEAEAGGARAGPSDQPSPDEERRRAPVPAPGWSMRLAPLE